MSLLLMAGRAAAQTGGSSVCPGPGETPTAIASVVNLLNRVQELGVAVALAAAGVAFLYVGFLLMRGTPPAVKRAKHVAGHVVVGLAVVLLAGGFVEVVRQPLCPG